VSDQLHAPWFTPRKEPPKKTKLSVFAIRTPYELVWALN